MATLFNDGLDKQIIPFEATKILFMQIFKPLVKGHYKLLCSFYIESEFIKYGSYAAHMEQKQCKK